MRRFSILLLSLTAATTARSQQIAYPPSNRGDVTDNYFGHSVSDPYRWMEELDSPATKNWVESENAITFAYLDKLPQHVIIEGGGYIAVPPPASQGFFGEFAAQIGTLGARLGCRMALKGKAFALILCNG